MQILQLCQTTPVSDDKVTLVYLSVWTPSSWAVSEWMNEEVISDIFNGHQSATPPILSLFIHFVNKVV